MFKEDGQEYAQVVKMLGNGRLEAFCFDGERRMCHIRGKLRKKVCLCACILTSICTHVCVRDSVYINIYYSRSMLRNYVCPVSCSF